MYVWLVCLGYFENAFVKCSQPWEEATKDNKSPPTSNSELVMGICDSWARSRSPYPLNIAFFMCQLSQNIHTQLLKTALSWRKGLKDHPEDDSDLINNMLKNDYVFIAGSSITERLELTYIQRTPWSSRITVSLWILVPWWDSSMRRSKQPVWSRRSFAWGSWRDGIRCRSLPNGD